MSAVVTPDPAATLPSRQHARRLRDYYRSAGWPCLDAIEIDLLQLGFVERVPRGAGTEIIRVTPAGMQALAASLARNRNAFSAHETAVRETGRQLALSGRLVYRSLALRGHVGDGWRLCRPDVYSIRHTSVAAYACPAIHEIKVRRADLLGDIASADKRASYMALSCEFFYVLPEGLARLDEIPCDCGVLFMTPTGLKVARPSMRRTVVPGIGEWMAIARRAAEYFGEDESQLALQETAAARAASQG
jgi:hypothetical protein